MKLVIDCGSTKADWAIINDSELIKVFKTEGFNPNYTDKEAILEIVSGGVSCDDYVKCISEIFFYGSGCGNEANCKIVKDVLSSVYVNANVSVTHDMMATCYALFGKGKGIACILGTGSNSCYYNGVDIEDKAVSLGYVLGDEGSGSHLGKVLVHDYFYNRLPAELSERFEREYDVNLKSLLDNIYHNNNVSRYLASFAKFLYDNKEHEFIYDMCYRCFDEFVEYFIVKYELAKHMEIGFVGSIAYYFQDIIKRCLEDKGLRLGKVLKSPIEGLIDFHSC